MSLPRMLGPRVPWGYPSRRPARSMAGHLAAKGKDGLGKGRIYPEPCTPLLEGAANGDPAKHRRNSQARWERQRQTKA